MNTIQIFQGFIVKYNTVYPRAIEILIGIFVNMTSLSETISLKIVKNFELIQFIIHDCFGPMHDVQVVTQCVRLFSLFLTNTNENSDTTNTKRLFIEFLKQESLQESEEKENNRNDSITTNWERMIEKFYFILEQSLNPILLDSAILFLLSLLDYDDDTLNYLTINERLLESICTACKTRLSLATNNTTCYQFTSITASRSSNANLSGQTPSVAKNDQTQLMQQTSQDDICHTDHLLNKYFMCLHTISTNEQGVMAFYCKFDLVINLFNEYLDKCLITLNDWEIRSADSLKTSVGEESLQNFSCILSVLNCVYSNHENFTNIDYLFSDFFLKLFTFCQSYLKLFNDLKKTEVLDEFSATINSNLELAKTNLKDLISNIHRFIKQNDIDLKRLINNCILLLENN